MNPIYVGIDLGGTNVKAGVVESSGKLLAHASVKTGAGVEDVITHMVEAANQALQAAGKSLADVAAVGIDSPGAVDSQNGIVLASPNIPGFINVPLRDKIAAALQKPVVLENDAKAAAFGEYWAGAGKTGQIKNLMMITLGTGVGGGIILDGKVLHGRDNVAGEIGHTIVVFDGDPCPCGQRGCLERYCSASRAAARAADFLKSSGRASSLQAILRDTGEVSSAAVVQHAQAGDALALELWDETTRFIAIACINVFHMLDPEMIVLAGGMAQAGEFLRARVESHVQKMVWKISPFRAKIALAELGNNMGVIGAAGLAKAAQTVP